MIGRLKAFAKRHWPALRLRTILFSVLLFVASLPGVSAIFLRVYENTLVRQTEAELIAQAAALAATASALWPSQPGAAPVIAPAKAGDYQPEPLSIDLGSTPVLGERPRATKATGAADTQAVAAAGRLAPILKATSRTTLASIVMTDGEGRILIGAEAGGGYAALPEVRSALHGDPATTLRRNGAYRPRYAFEWLSRASPLRIHYARPIWSGGRVVGVLLLSRSPRALFRGIYQDRGKIILGTVLIAGVLVVLAGLVSRGVTRPIEALSAASRAMAAGYGVAPETPETAAVEVQALYEDFRTMAQAIERRSRYLRDFAAAVSHEFKTPLAGIRGAVELLQDHQAEMDGAERRRFLDNVAADGARLSQLVDRLLELARADMTAPDLTACTDLRAPVLQAADALRTGGLGVTVSLPEDLPAVSVPAATVQAVLTTLVENSRQAGARHVTVEGRRTRRHVELLVTDDGPGVPAGDRDRIFEPFFTSRRTSGGTGLGLPIARSMLAASQGELELLPSTGGARFQVRLPQARA
jgi:two-component system, OmpR family, sensor histidine kinase ChvG